MIRGLTLISLSLFAMAAALWPAYAAIWPLLAAVALGTVATVLREFRAAYRRPTPAVAACMPYRGESVPITARYAPPAEPEPGIAVPNWPLRKRVPSKARNHP